MSNVTGASPKGNFSLSDINPFSTHDGAATTSESIKFCGTAITPDGLGPVNWAIRKTYNSLVGAGPKIWRNLPNFWSARPGKTASSTKNSEDVSDECASSSSLNGEDHDDEVTVDLAGGDAKGRHARAMAADQARDLEIQQDTKAFEDFGPVDDSLAKSAFAEMDAIAERNAAPKLTVSYETDKPLLPSQAKAAKAAKEAQDRAIDESLWRDTGNDDAVSGQGNPDSGFNLAAQPPIYPLAVDQKKS